MQAGTLLLIFSDVVQLLKTQAYILDDGSFDDKKFSDVQQDTQLIAGVESILIKHGVVVPSKVDKIIQILPLVASLVK